jgi:A/G-specific adenine glycosylase
MVSDSRIEVSTAVPADQHPAIRRALRAWWRRERRRFPWREAGDPYAVFLAETALQKTQVAKAIRAYAELVGAYPTARALAAAPMEHLDRVFAWLGLKKRARFLQLAAQAIVARHDGRLPHAFEDLVALPGIGDYSANAILCFGHGAAAPIVDSTIARVLKRLLGFSSTKKAWQDPVAWAVARSFLDVRRPVEHNYALLDLAALVCLPRAPRCDACPVAEWCASRRPA